MARVETTPSSSEVLRQVDEFFMSTGPVQKTLRSLARRLSAEQIDYAVIDRMALALQGFVRPTQDVDLLLTREGLERFHAALAGLGYVPAFPGARKHFRDAETGVKVGIITAGEYPVDGRPKPVAFPAPADVAVEAGEVRVARLETLIELKLASGLSAEHRRLRDLADVQQLVETLDLPADLCERLDASVREEYQRLWQLAQQARAQEEASDG